MTASWLLLVALAASSLAPRHRAWLEEEVHFLMSTRERERFLALEEESERDRFIEAFWVGRDRREHEKRLLSSDRLFAPRGRFSQRGRFYQLLGPPSFREDFARAGGRLVPIELWHYTGVRLSFLPESFYLVFFRPGGSGDYRLWRPLADGVEALVAGSEPGRWRLAPEPEELKRTDPELASAVRELVPGGGLSRSAALLASLHGLADRLAPSTRVEGRVETSVSVEPLEASLVCASLLDDALVPELHYALELAVGENRRLAWREQGGRLRTRFSLMGRFLDASGVERERWEDTIELDVTRKERHALEAAALSFQGRRLLPDGVRRVELALVSEAGAGTTLGADVEAPGTMPLLLVRNHYAFDGGAGRLPFRVGNVLLSPEPWTFVGEASLTAVSQIEGPTEATWEVWRDGALTLHEEEVTSDSGAPVLVMQEIRALESKDEARFRVRFSTGRIASTLDFFSAPGTTPTEIRVLAREPTEEENARYRLARGRAFARGGELFRAAEEMKQATLLRPGEARYHLELAKVLYAAGRHEEVLELLGAVERRFGDEVDLYVLMAASSEALGIQDRALAYYRKAVALDPGNAELREARDRSRARTRR